MPEQQESGPTSVCLEDNSVEAAEFDMVRMLEETRESQYRAERAVRVRDELLAVVCHDLRNPMSTLALGIAALSRYLPLTGDDTIGAQVQRMKRSLATMERLIGDLVDIRAIEAGVLQIRTEPDDLASILEEALDLLRPLATQRGQDLWLEVLPGIVVRADRQRIIQVLSNIVGNAIKFTPPQGWIRVRGRQFGAEDGRLVEVEVADSGNGIDGKDLPRVFDKFWRGSCQQGGLGLGLAIAKAVVEAHGGLVWAESPAGGGAVFRFTLPSG